MQGQFNKSFSFVRTTAIGGVLFLLPIVVVAALLAYVFQAVVAAHKHLQPWLPFDSATGIALLFGLAIIVLLVMIKMVYDLLATPDNLIGLARGGGGH